MAKIISMSLDHGLLEEIDELQKSGFSGRSEIMRSGVKLLLDDMREKKELKDHTACVLIIEHEKQYEPVISKIIHKYQSVITTQIHNNVCKGKCLEVVVLHGDGKKISDLFSEIRTNRNIAYSKLIVP